MKLSKPVKTGYYKLHQSKTSTKAFVNMDRKEVFLPSSEHPYNLDDLISASRKWVFRGTTKPKGW